MGDAHSNDPLDLAPQSRRPTISMTRLVVWGMYCPNCATRIHRSLIALDGVIDVEVNHTVGMAEVVFDSEVTTIAALIDAVIRAGGDGRHEFGATVSHTPMSGRRH